LQGRECAEAEESIEEAAAQRQNAEALARKIKIHEKAGAISSQQVDRFV